MRLITVNEGRKQSVQQTRADFETIKRLKGIVGFQEIDEADTANEHALLKGVLGPTNELVGMTHYVPIAVPKRQYKVVASREIFGTGGVAHYSPARFFTVVLVKRKKSLTDTLLNREQKVFVVINTHYPAGAYHGDRPRGAENELQKHWDEQYKKHRELMKDYVDKGFTVFWTGDSNRASMPKTHPREVQVVTAGIDNICYVEGGIKVKVLRKGIHDLHSDHPALYADFELG